MSWTYVCDACGREIKNADPSRSNPCYLRMQSGWTLKQQRTEADEVVSGCSVKCCVEQAIEWLAEWATRAKEEQQDA